jgi:DNA-binding SARP family transcriptional activator
MEFRILGPLTAVDDGRAVELPRRKHRALLAALLLRAGETVSGDRLIEDLWGESPPRTARDALQNYVSLLRKSLGSDVLVTREGGYLLDVSPEQVDAVRFQRLAAEAREIGTPVGRAAKLREALELWRGAPLADLSYEPFATVEIARLEDLRLAATQDLIDAELELGRDADLVPELETLIQEHPFDERLRGQLMLALYRGGRQAEALEAYRTARRMLDEDLGLEPGPPLRELEQAILRHDPALATPAVAKPVTLPTRRTVTVLFADLVDSSSLVEGLDPEAAHLLLQGYFAAARAAVESHGGIVEKFIGDAVMAVFGAPVAHEDDALRAVRAALEIRERVPAADERLEVRVGVNTGEVLAGAGGEVLVTGAAVTVAKRLEQAARGGEVLVGASTQRLVRDAVRSRQTKRPDPPAFRVEALIEGAPGIARRLARPLVDREVELEELRRAFQTARDERRCIVFTGFGDAGIGKTRLARELMMQVRDEATVLVGRCVSYGEGATFLPLREMIDDFDDLIASAGSRGDVFLATRRRFEELAESRPVLLVFEDVHWAEPTLLDLIEYLGAQSAGSPILALCLSRPDLLADRGGWSEVGPSLVLEPLTEDQAHQLIGDAPQADRIVEIAEGNPLYVEQLVASVEEAGEEALDTVPASVEALLASRLDRVPPDERAFAQRAAVVGRRFSPAAVAALGSVEALPGLERAGFVHRAGTLYRFHHVLVRDVVYAGTPKADRAELHRQHAAWLDEQPDGSDELVGYHLEQAAGYLGELGAPAEEAEDLAVDAGRRLAAAGIRAWKRGDAAAAVNLLGRAVALLPARDTYRLELMCELGGALRTRGAFERAEAVFTEARDEAAAADERRLELRADLGRLAAGLFAGKARPGELLERALEAIPELENAGDDRALGRAWLYVDHVEGPYRSHFAAAAAAARKALVHYRRSGWPVAACLGALCSALANGPTPVPEAIQACQDLLADADLNGQANVLPFLGVLEAMRGAFARAREHVLRGWSMQNDLGQPLSAEISAGDTAGQVELAAGDLPAAQAAFERSLALLRHMGAHDYAATRAVQLADVLYRRGRFEEAAREVEPARSELDADDLGTQSRWRSVAARLAAREGSVERADELSLEALEILEGTDGLNTRAECLLARAEVLSLAGRAEESAAAIREALRLYEQKENVVGAEQARALLSETTESP